MDTGIPAAIVAAILMVSSVVLARTGFHSFDDMGQTWKEMEVRAGEQARTEPAIASVAMNGAYLDVELRNDGATKWAEFEHMDVVVEYTDTGDNRVVRWLPYTDGSLNPNTWVVQGIAGDAFDPGMVNPTETLQTRIELSPAIKAGSVNRVIITTEQGVTVSSNFTG
jgi:hypothetical protein